MTRFLVSRSYLFKKEYEMKRSTIAITILILVMLIVYATHLISDSPPTVRIIGIPRNGNATKSMVCPPGTLPCDNDCVWNLSFSAEIKSDKGISSTEGRVESENQVVTNDPPLNPCDSGPVKRTITTFTRDFTVACPGEHNGCNTDIFPIDFGGYDCEGYGGFAYMRLKLKCYYCSNDDFVAVDGNGLTEIGYADYDRNVAIQFVVLNLDENTNTVNLTPMGTHPWPYDPPFPPSIELGPGESREFLVNINVPAATLPMTEYIFTLNADAVNGLWVFDSDTILVTEYTSVDEDITVPTAFYLSQNFPNPFNPVTEIEYDLLTDCHVRLDIFDVQGRKVAVLVDEWQDPGRKAVRWNGIDMDGNALSSGIFFCRMQACDYVEVRKLVLVK